jgi:hypothetical protein
MKQFSMRILTFATVAVTISGMALAQDMSQSASNPAAGNPPQYVNQPMKLMAGNARLDRTLKTNSAVMGQAISARLTAAIHTPEGVELPRDTELLGRVDKVQASTDKGPAMLSVTFYQARMKDGKTLPIKAIVAAFASPSATEPLPQAVAADDSFDQEPGAIGDVALNSAVANRVSGTFTDAKGNFTLPQGTQLLIGVGVPSPQAAAGAE